MKVTNKTILFWIRENLGKYIRKAIKGTPYTEELLAGIVRREVGHLLVKYIWKQEEEKEKQCKLYHFREPLEKWTFEKICSKMKGDWGMRKGELYPRYHGFGFPQIDIGSYPEFVKSGKWQDPYESFVQAVKCLEEKREQLNITTMFKGGYYEQMVIAAYNCGASRVSKAVKKHNNIDYYTYKKDYSKSVLKYAEEYKRLFIIDKKNIEPKGIEPVQYD